MSYSIGVSDLSPMMTVRAGDTREKTGLLKQAAKDFNLGLTMGRNRKAYAEALTAYEQIAAVGDKDDISKGELFTMATVAGAALGMLVGSTMDKVFGTPADAYHVLDSVVNLNKTILNPVLCRLVKDGIVGAALAAFAFPHRRELYWTSWKGSKRVHIDK